MPRPLWQRMLRDPICHFAVLAGALFGLHAALAPPERPVIVLDPAALDRMIEAGAADLATATDAYVADEILLREAVRRGLERAPLIRAQLIQAIRFALTPEPPKPSEQDLRAFFAAHQAQFQLPPTVSVSQVLVAEGQVLPELNTAGEAAALARHRIVVIRRAVREDLLRALGREATEASDTIDNRSWHGPFRCPRGACYLRIDERQAGAAVVFADVAERVAAEWAIAWQQDSVRRQVVELARGYDVIAAAAR